MGKFRGVATKYLADYMYWFKWQEFFKTDKDIIQCRNLMVHSHTIHINSKVNDFVLREAAFKKRKTVGMNATTVISYKISTRRFLL